MRFSVCTLGLLPFKKSGTGLISNGPTSYPRGPITPLGQ